MAEGYHSPKEKLGISVARVPVAIGDKNFFEKLSYLRKIILRVYKVLHDV